jgi:hypothetical protein
VSQDRRTRFELRSPPRGSQKESCDGFASERGLNCERRTLCDGFLEKALTFVPGRKPLRDQSRENDLSEQCRSQRNRDQGSERVFEAEHDQTSRRVGRFGTLRGLSRYQRRRVDLASLNGREDASWLCTVTQSRAARRTAVGRHVGEIDDELVVESGPVTLPGGSSCVLGEGDDIDYPSTSLVSLTLRFAGRGPCVMTCLPGASIVGETCH